MASPDFQCRKRFIIFTKNFFLLYNFLKVVVRLAMLIFCRRIIINDLRKLQEPGPLLLASNHPNSFLDAVILDVLFERPIWSLARGDVFRSKLTIKLLTAVRILPVYRVSEGVANLSANYQTFDQCQQLFQQRQIVLIFSEGKCINEWHLRPLKKGTARLAISSWDNDIPLRVLPIGINYSSFRRFGKNVMINFGDIISSTDVVKNASDGARIQAFNSLLNKQLRQLVLEIDKKDKATQEKSLAIRPSPLRQALMAVPAAAGWLLHIPLYLPIKLFTLKKAAHNDHYDSILVMLLLFTYPLYLALLATIIYAFTHSLYALLVVPLAPFAARCCVQLKGQLDR